MDKKYRSLVISLMILAVLAMINTVYLTSLHYSPDGSSICDFGGNLNCGIVNKSVYAEVFGIPVAALGFLTFLSIFILNLLMFKSKKKKKLVSLSKLQLIILIISALFSLYLIYVQSVLLLTYCLFCLLLDAIIFISLILSIVLNNRINNSRK